MNIFDTYGIKELFDVSLRIKHPIEVDGRKYQTNEVLFFLDKAELATIRQQTDEVAATGGYHNNMLINWETDKEINFGLKHGRLSPVSLALLSNSKLGTDKIISIPFNETVGCIDNNDYCYVDLKFAPNNLGERYGIQGNPNNEPLPMGRVKELRLKPLPPREDKYIFCYEEYSGEPILDFEVYGNRIFFKKDYRKVLVDYTFNSPNHTKTIEVGNRLLNGFLRLTGKMSVKNSSTGEVTTALIEIPKIKLSSNLSITLGKQASESMVSDFYFTGYPDENIRREKQKICNITFLNTELTGDYI